MTPDEDGCTCGASAFNSDKTQRGTMAHRGDCPVYAIPAARSRTTTPAEALRMLDAQFADPGEQRTAAYERQIERADAFMLSIEYTHEVRP